MATLTDALCDLIEKMHSGHEAYQFVATRYILDKGPRAGTLMDVNTVVEMEYDILQDYIDVMAFEPCPIDHKSGNLVASFTGPHCPVCYENDRKALWL